MINTKFGETINHIHIDMKSLIREKTSAEFDFRIRKVVYFENRRQTEFIFDIALTISAALRGLLYEEKMKIKTGLQKHAKLKELTSINKYRIYKRLIHHTTCDKVVYEYIQDRLICCYGNNHFMTRIVNLISDGIYKEFNI